MWIRVLRWMMMLGLANSAQAEDRVIPADSPSLEVLEYLGQLVESDGELIGPENFEEDQAGTTESDAPTKKVDGTDKRNCRDSWGVPHE